jgi:hypothetical protein
MKADIKEAGGPLPNISDIDLFRETAFRLSQQYQQQHNTPFLFGSFDFVFHKGVLRCIEERPRNKRYFDDELPEELVVRRGAR